jgi:hypothetical protein
MVAPLTSLPPPCFRYPASPAPARPRIAWRSRAIGFGVQAADRENLTKKEVTSVGRKEESRRQEEVLGRQEILEEEVVSRFN